ncbi:hypothetical protein LROSL1_2061 [Furfurilactobacillus rossiae]|nr:hypothetical protein [Furfurilactobacillus rossiae]QLE64862.1 hypothetical protein LROSL1_2061 [Furfurilactobacillus rossiae]
MNKISVFPTISKNDQSKVYGGAGEHIYKQARLDGFPVAND